MVVHLQVKPGPERADVEWGMYTVELIEMEIRVNEKQSEVIDMLITRIRAEPAWQSDRVLDAASQEVKDVAEDTFETMHRAAERAQSGNTRFRDKVYLIRLNELAEETQGILKDMHEANVELASGMSAMKIHLLTLLNGLLEARGQPPFELISSSAN